MGDCAYHPLASAGLDMTFARRMPEKEAIYHSDQGAR
jgi:hypothetical protein